MNTHIVRLLLVGFLAIALPLQSFAAVLTSGCHSTSQARAIHWSQSATVSTTAEHHDLRASSPDELHNPHANHHASHGSSSDGTFNQSHSHGSSCGACCAGVLPTADSLLTLEKSASVALLDHRSRLHPSPLIAGLERPPRLYQA